MYQVGNFSNSSNLFYNCNRLQQLAQEGRDSNKGLNIKHLLRPFAFADRLATQFNATYIRGDNVKASATRKAAAFVVKALSFLVVAPILAGAYLFLEALNVTLRLVIFKGLCKGILYDKLMMPLYRAATGQPSEQAKILALNLQIGLILKSDLSDSDKNFAIKDLLSEDFPDQGKEIIKHFPELARQYDLEITPEAPLFVAQYVSGLFKSARFISAPIVNQSLNDGFNLEENLDNIQYLGRSNQINEQLPKLQLSSPSPTNDDSNSDIDPELDEDGFDRIVDTTKKRNIARQNSEFGTNFNHGPEISHENRTKIDAIMRTEISTPTSIDDRVSRSIDSTIDSDFEI